MAGRLGRVLGGGLVGACALTALHETTRRVVPGAPRMDLLGMRALTRAIRGLGQEPPGDGALRAVALGGDLVVNAAYYGLAGLAEPEDAPGVGLALGLAAGVGAVWLPGPMGLGEGPSRRTAATAAMTVGLYAVGGLAAGLACRGLATIDR